jgi:vesicle coat complex subunit
MPETYSKTDSTKFCSPFGTCSNLLVPKPAIVRIMAITSHVTNKTCPCRVNPATSQYKCVPTSTAANEKKT